MYPPDLASLGHPPLGKGGYTEAKDPDLASLGHPHLAAIAVPGPASRRPANGAAAEIPGLLLLPPAAQARNPLP